MGSLHMAWLWLLSPCSKWPLAVSAVADPASLAFLAALQVPALLQLLFRASYAQTHREKHKTSPQGKLHALHPCQVPGSWLGR